MGIRPAPVNHDGRVFYNDEGFIYRVSGSYNALYQTNREVFKEYKTLFDKVTYEVIKKEWFILSGYKGNEIIYIKCYVGKEYTYTLLMRYPIKDKAIYDETLSHIVKSFRPGPLSQE